MGRSLRREDGISRLSFLSADAASQGTSQSIGDDHRDGESERFERDVREVSDARRDQDFANLDERRETQGHQRARHELDHSAGAQGGFTNGGLVQLNDQTSDRIAHNLEAARRTKINLDVVRAAESSLLEVQLQLF